MSSLADLVNQYKQKLEGGYQPKDYSENYTAIGDAISGAYNAQYDAQKAQLEDQAVQLGRQARANRGNAYVTAQKSALKNEEALASAGLGRGVNNDAASGFQEAQRAEQAAQMQKDITALNVAEQQGKTDISNEIATAGHDKDLKVSSALSDLELQKLSTNRAEEQFAKEYDLTMYNSLVQAYAAEMAAQQAAAELALARQQAAQQNAYNELNSFGKIVTPESAAALGVDVGYKIKRR